MTAYSSGLALQAAGVRIHRSRSVALDGTLGVAMTLYALLVSNLLDTVASPGQSYGRRLGAGRGHRMWRLGPRVDVSRREAPGDGPWIRQVEP